MQLTVTVNDVPVCVAGIPSTQGFVSVHVVAYPGRDTAPVVRAAASYDPTPHETVHLKWGGQELVPGDIVTVRCATGLSASPPTQRFSTRDDERIAVRDPQVASHINEAVQSFQDTLCRLANEMASSSSESDGRAFKRAVGHVLASLGEYLLEPLWNAHPALRPKSNETTKSRERSENPSRPSGQS